MKKEKKTKKAVSKNTKTKIGGQNYTLTFVDEDLKKKFYFAGFVRTAGSRVATGCQVPVMRFTKEAAEMVKENFKKVHPGNKTIKIVKVGG